MKVIDDLPSHHKSHLTQTKAPRELDPQSRPRGFFLSDTQDGSGLSQDPYYPSQRVYGLGSLVAAALAATR